MMCNASTNETKLTLHTFIFCLTQIVWEGWFWAVIFFLFLLWLNSYTVKKKTSFLALCDVNISTCAGNMRGAVSSLWRCSNATLKQFKSCVALQNYASSKSNLVRAAAAVYELVTICVTQVFHSLGPEETVRSRASPRALGGVATGEVTSSRVQPLSWSRTSPQSSGDRSEPVKDQSYTEVRSADAKQERWTTTTRRRTEGRVSGRSTCTRCWSSGTWGSARRPSSGVTSTRPTPPTTGPPSEWTLPSRCSTGTQRPSDSSCGT